MSTSVDNRVVKMVLDNAQFERAVNTTIETLAKFEKALSLNNASQGFEEISKAAGKVDLSNLSEGAAKEVSKLGTIATEAAESISRIDDSAQNADFSPMVRSAYSAVEDINLAMTGLDISSIYDETQEAANGFSMLSQVGLGAMLELGAGIENYVVSKLKGLKDGILTPIKEGFGEYETQIGAIQTIIANTGMDFDSDDDIDKVNNALDELNKYADKTVYKFSDMVNAIGRFTAAGLGLEQSTQAVQGVANVAALAGASMQDVSRVLPQIAQALSSGTVSMQDWFSVETANMNSKIFVNRIADVAMHMAEVGKAEQSAYEAGQAILEQGVTMRSALNKSDSKEWSGWFTSDILANTLQLFTYDKRSMTASEVEEAKDYFRSIGYTTEAEFNELFKQATMAQRAAQEVRTFSQLMDTVGESIGSNWTGIWRNFLGDFKQATDTFTLLSDNMTAGVDALFGGINNAALRFNASGAYDIIFGKSIVEEDPSGNLVKTGERIVGALDNVITAIQKPLAAIGSAFGEVFGMSDKELDTFWKNLATGIRDFTQSLIISDNAAISLHDIFKGLFSVAEVGITIISDGMNLVGIAIENVRVLLDPMVDIVLAILGQVGKLLSWASEKFMEVRQAVITLLTPLDVVRKFILEVVEAFFKWIDIPGKINLVGDGLIGILDILWKIIDIPGKISGLGEILGNILHFIGDITGWNAAVEESNKILEETGVRVNTVDIWIKNLLKNPVVDFFSKILESLLQPVIAIKDFALGIANADDATRKSLLTKFWDDLKSKVELISGPLSVAFEAIKNIAGAIGEFAGKVLEYEPVANFIESIQKFFTDLPGKLTKIGSVIGTELSGIKTPFDAFIGWLNEKAEYLKNVTVEQFVTDIKGYFSGLKTFFTEEFTPKLVWAHWLKFLDELPTNLDNLTKPLMNIFKAIETEFPLLQGILTGGLTLIKDAITGAIAGISRVVLPALRRADTFPEAFKLIFENIKTIIVTKIEEIKNAILTFKPSDLLSEWVGFRSKIEEFTNNLFPGLAKVIHEVLMKFDNFFTRVTSGATTWEQVFNRVTGSIGEKISNLPVTFYNAFQLIKRGLAKVLASATEMLAMLPGDIGGFFSNISSKLRQIGELEYDPSKAIEAYETFKDIIGKGFSSKIDLVGGIKKWIDDQVDKLPDIVKVIPEKIGNAIKTIKETFEKITIEDVEKIISVINGILVGRLLFSMSGFVTSLTGFVKTMTGQFAVLASEITRHLKAKNKEDEKSIFEEFAENFKAIAASLAIVAGSLWIISTIQDVEKAATVLVGMGTVIVAMEALSGLINKFLGGNNGVQVLAAAASLGVLAIDIFAALKAIEILTDFSWEDNAKGLLAGVAMLGVFGTFIALVTRFGGDGAGSAIQAAVAILALCGAVNILLPTIEQLANSITAQTAIGKIIGTEMTDTINNLVVSFGAVCLLILSIGHAIGEAGNHGISAGIGFILAAESIKIMAGAIQTLAEIPFENLLASMGGLALLLFEYSMMTAKLSAIDMAGTAVSIVIFAQALKMIGEAIGSLSQTNADNIAKITVDLMGLVAVFGAITTWTSGVDLIASGAAMVIFGASLVEMAVGLEMMASIDSDALGYSAEAVVALVASLGLVTAWTSGVDLIASAAGMVIFGASIIEISAGLSLLSEIDADALRYSATAIVGLVAALGIVTTWTSGADLLASSVAMLLYADSLVYISNALDQLAKLPSGDLTKAAIAMGAVMAAFAGLTALTNTIDLIGTAAGLDLFAIALIGIASAMQIFAEALNTMPDGQKIHDIGYNLLAGIADGMVAGAKAIITGFMDIGGIIIQGIKDFFGIHSPSTVMEEEIGKYLPAGIAQGITNNSGDITDALSGIVTSITNWISTEGTASLKSVMETVGNWIQTDGIPLLKTAAQGVWEWANTDGVQLFGELMDWLGKRAGELKEKFTAWMESDGLPLIKKVGTDIWNWLTTDGVKLAGEVLKWLGDRAGELASAFGKWMETDGIPMLEKLGSDIWHWITTDGVDLFVKFLGWLGEKALDLKDKFIKWVTDKAIPFVGEKLGDLGESIFDWIKGIPGKIIDILSSFAPDWNEIGDNMAQGIANGITDGIDWITNAITGLGQQGLDGIKNFFGIQSPSTVMRDEVGINLTKGIAEGLRDGMVYSDEAWVALKKSIADNAKRILDDVDGKQIAKSKMNSLYMDIRDDADLNELAQSIGEHFPKRIAEAILRSPAFYVENYSNDYLEQMKGAIEYISKSGLSYIDESELEAEGKLDEVMFKLLQYVNSEAAAYLQEHSLFINDQFQLTTMELSEGLYESGKTIPQAFIDGIGEGFETNRFHWDIQEILSTSDMDVDRSKFDYEDEKRYLYNDDAILKGFVDVKEAFAVAAETLPKVFSDEFATHANESLPIVTGALKQLMLSPLVDLTDEQGEYIASIVSAGEVIDDAFNSGVYEVLHESFINHSLTLEELANVVGQHFPENIANGILMHSNLPVEQIAGIAESMHSAIHAATVGDTAWYTEELTMAYSRIVDSFMYEINNAQDVKELGEIIGRYFPEGMGTGITENRDVPMQEMIANLEWMAMNGQLQVPGFEETGEQLGLAVENGVVKGLFADWEKDSPPYLTDYANKMREQSGDLMEPTGSGYAKEFTNGMSEGLAGQDGVAGAVATNLNNISQLAQVPAQQAGTAIGTSVVGGTETGMSGMTNAVTGAVDSSESKAVDEGKTVGTNIGKAIIDGMNDQLNDPESGLIKAITTAGENIISKAEQLGKEVADGIIKGITEGFKISKESEIGKTLQSAASAVLENFGLAASNGASEVIKKKDLEVLKEYEFKAKIINLEKDSKTVLTEILNEALKDNLKSLGETNEKSIGAAGTEAAKTISEANKTNIETLESNIVKEIPNSISDAAKTVSESNKTNISSILSEFKYSEALEKIDTAISDFYDSQKVHNESIIKEIQDIKSTQEDIYKALNDTTNNHLNEIEINTGKSGDIYMDTGALVGAIASEMDQALGYQQILSSRGA